MPNYVQEIQAIFSDILLRSSISPTTNLLESGLLDSMSFVELLFQLEQRFGYTANLAELELENFRSIDQIAHLLAANHSVRPSHVQAV